MREILFRGKCNYNGDWVEGNLFIPDKEDTPTQICIGTNIVRITYDIIPETVGQYTGLTDKNGKKIFEGDIVKIDGKYIRYIEYSGECSAFVKFRYIDRLTSEFSGYLGKGYDNYKQTLEVIGNIHDNPELLKGGK